MAYLTIKQLATKYSAFTEGALRNMFQHRDENGLSMTVLKIGPRKILVDDSLFEEWLESHRELTKEG